MNYSWLKFLLLLILLCTFASWNCFHLQNKVPQNSFLCIVWFSPTLGSAVSQLVMTQTASWSHTQDPGSAPRHHFETSAPLEEAFFLCFFWRSGQAAPTAHIHTHTHTHIHTHKTCLPCASAVCLCHLFASHGDKLKTMSYSIQICKDMYFHEKFSVAYTKAFLGANAGVCFEHARAAEIDTIIYYK